MATGKHQPRESLSRETKERKKVWKPRNRQQHLIAPEGYKYRYVRRQVKGLGEDTENILGRMEEGYIPVTPDEIKGQVENVRVLEEGKIAGTVVAGDSILMKIPQELADQRTEYYRQKVKQMEKAIDNDLMKENNPKMPISKSRNTRVEVGDRKAKFVDEGVEHS